MAKGQKRGNRELKKPKSNKNAAPPAASTLISKGLQALAALKKKP